MKNRTFLLIPALFGLLTTGCGEQEKPAENNEQNQQSGDNSQQGGEQQGGGEQQSGGNTQVTQYTITFKDENDVLLESKKWDEGVVPSYNYTKNDTAEWDYTVQGWSLSLGGEATTIPAASADATYWAVISKVKRSYTVAFYNENGGLISSESLEYGSQPECDYTGPADTAEWDYTFAGWSLTQGGSALPAIPTVTGEASYYAVVNSNKKQYSVCFYDENSNLLGAANLDYGEVPSYTYNKQDTQEWDYTMEGWATTPGGIPLTTLPAVTGEAAYYAVVSKVKQRYTITFVSRGDTNVNSITDDYGTEVAKPSNPQKENHSFVSWSYDQDGSQVVSWPLTLVRNETLYGNWNETIDIKSYFQTLIAIVGHDPYSYIPETMLPENSTNHVTAGSVNYDFTNFTNVSSIKYGGFGEQWHMVIENIKESEKFYSVLSLGEAAINASVALFNNYLDNNPGTTADHTLNETLYSAKIDFHNGVLSYTIQYKTDLNIPFFGEVLPQVDMTYNIATLEKAVRIQLSENNAMKYVVTDNTYTFGLEYGVTTVSRKAYFTLERSDDDSVEGHIYEFVQYKDKDLVPACADFYINETYTSVVGNKASGMPGFTGYINELYKTDQGKLLGYEVRETFTKWGISATYHTLWFNLNNINGINSVKAIATGEVSTGLGADNPHDIYLNGSASIFTPAYNKKLGVKTSRKYDVEMRKQFFYGIQTGEIVEYEVEIPMMFIQADHDGYTNFSDFHDDMEDVSGISNASVNLSSTYLDKIQADYAELIDIFIAHKGEITGEAITAYVGNAIEIN